MKKQAVALLSFLLLAACSAVPLAHVVIAAEQPARDEIEIYNFLQLIDKADRIVLAEIGERQNDRVQITPIETLKEPARDPASVTPEMIKLAEERLKQNGAKPKAAKDDEKKSDEKLQLLVNAELKLPPAGTQALFFLWKKENDADGQPAGFRVNHPQCIYDASVLPQVRAGLFKPRSIADGRFLREWDRKTASKLAQRKADEELKKLPMGEPVVGMKMECARVKLAIRGDNSFLLSTHLVNVFNKEQSVYDGPASAYGAILRAKDASPEKGIVLRLGGFDGLDPAALNITSFLDFESIEGNQLLSREHTFDTKDFPILKALVGKYMVRTFYANTHDGVVKNRPKESLDKAAWTGTVVSKEVEIEFKEVK